MDSRNINYCYSIRLFLYGLWASGLTWTHRCSICFEELARFKWELSQKSDTLQFSLQGPSEPEAASLDPELQTIPPSVHPLLVLWWYKMDESFETVPTAPSQLHGLRSLLIFLWMFLPSDFVMFPNPNSTLCQDPYFPLLAFSCEERRSGSHGITEKSRGLGHNPRH